MLYRKNIIAITSIMLICGILLSRWVGHEASWYVLPVCVLMVLMWFLRTSRLFLGAYCLLVLLIGSWVATIDASTFKSGVPDEFHDTWVRCKGRVASMPKQKEQGKRVVTSFVLNCEEMRVNKRVYPVRERIQISLINTSAEPLWGDYIKVYGRGTIPKEARNAGQFDYREYLSRKQIYYVVRAFGEKSTRVYKRHGPVAKVTRTITQVREHIRSRIREDFDGVARSFAYAFLLGERGSIPYDIKDDFVRTGTIHVLAISGMHVSLVAGFLCVIFRIMRVPLSIHAMCSMFLLIAYAFLCGGNVPVLRAVVMIGIVYCSYVLRKKRNFLTSISLACFIIIFLWPQYIYMPGFQLSFISVLSIVYVSPFFIQKTMGRTRVHKTRTGIVYLLYRVMCRIRRYVRQAFAVSVSALCGTTPVLLYHFHVVSFIGIVANSIIIPIIMCMLISTFFYLGSVLVFPSACALWVVLFRGCVSVLCVAVSFFSDMSVGRVSGSSTSGLSIIVYYVVMIVGLFWGRRAVSRRPIFLCLILITTCVYVCLNTIGEASSDGAMRISILDCGKSDVVYVKTEHHAILFNSGRGYPSFHARWVIKPFLFSQGIQKLSTVVMTSDRGKDWGGFDEIVRTFYPRAIVCSGQRGRDQLRRMRQEKYAVYECGDADLTLYPDDSISIHRFRVVGKKGDASHSIVSEKIYFLMYKTPGVLSRIPDDLHEQRLVVQVSSDMQEILLQELKELEYDRAMTVICSGEGDSALHAFVEMRGGVMLDTQRSGMVDLYFSEKGLVQKSYLLS